ncbi:MAG: DUF6067 family protein, partial [bacterium]|nr:DUF6067 family protein [bacterium]
LTPQWRWFFFDYKAENIKKLTKVSLAINFQGADGEVFEASLRNACANEIGAETETVVMPVEDIPTQFVVPFLGAPDKITGDLSHPVWNKATHISVFVNDKDPQRRISAVRNELYLFHDKSALYLGMRSRSKNGLDIVSQPRLKDSDMIYYDDNFELGIVPAEAAVMYQFIVNSVGSLYDGTFDKRSFNSSWNSSTAVATSSNGKDFCLEMRIPVRDIGIDGIRPGSIWKLTTVRNYRQEKLWSQDHLTPLKKGFSDWDRFAQLLMAGDDTAVDVDYRNCTTSYPEFSIKSKGGRGTALLNCAVSDANSTRLINADMSLDISNGDNGYLSVFLDYTEKNKYRVDMSLTDVADNVVLARMSRSFSVLQPLQATTDINCVAQTLTVGIDAGGIVTHDGRSLKGFVEVEKKDDPRLIISKSFDIAPGTTCSVVLPINELKDGVHNIDCYVRDSKGYLVAEVIEPVRIYKDIFWLDNGLGEEDYVPRPFTKPVFDEKQRTLADWGHKVFLGASVLPEQIYVQGAPLLSAPLELVGQINGCPYRLTGELKRSGPAKTSMISLSSGADTGGLKSVVNLNFDYDGMMKFDMDISGKQPISLEKIQLRIPLRREIADVLFNFTGQSTSEGTFEYAGMTMLKEMEYAADLYYTDINGDGRNSGLNKWDCKKFWPMLWVYNMDMGLCWFVESDQSWSTNKGDILYNLERNDKSVVLTINIITKPVKAISWRHTFGLLLTPSRPWDKYVEREMWARRTEYYAAVVKQADDMNEAASIHRSDANNLLITNSPVGSYGLDHPWTQRHMIMHPWVVMHHAPEEGWKREIYRRIHDFWTQEGRHMYFYNNASYTWWNSPEYKYFKNLWGLEKPGSFWEWEMVEVNRSCKSWQDYWIYNFYHMIKRYPENFISIDCCGIQTDTREINGMGYDRSGERISTLNIFETRQMVKRIYSIVEKQREHPMVLFHTWDPMLYSFCNLTERGEEWRGWKKHHFEQQGRNLDFFRYLSASKVGPVRGFMPQMESGAPRAKVVHGEGLMLLHNLYYDDTYNKFVGEKSKIRERIGLGVREDIEFHPYWKPDDVIRSSEKLMKVSYWKHPGGTYIIAMNTDWDNPSGMKADINLNLSLLGMKRVRISLFDPMQDKISDVAVTSDGRTKVSLDIPAGLFQIILVEEGNN